MEDVVTHRLAIEYQRREHLIDKMARLNEATGTALRQMDEVDQRIAGLRARLARTEKAVA
jgi:uncharacterized small protein (DUF1192 family)